MYYFPSFYYILLFSIFSTLIYIYFLYLFSTYEYFLFFFIFLGLICIISHFLRHYFIFSSFYLLHLLLSIFLAFTFIVFPIFSGLTFIISQVSAPTFLFHICITYIYYFSSFIFQLLSLSFVSYISWSALLLVLFFLSTSIYPPKECGFIGHLSFSASSGHMST